VTAVLRPWSLPRDHGLFRRFLGWLPLRQPAAVAHFGQHDTARRIRDRLGAEAWRDFLTFAVVRNPFDHAVSTFEFLRSRSGRRSARVLDGLTFAEALRLREERGPWWRPGSPLHMPDQAHWLLGEDGRVLVDRVLHVERLASEFPALCADLGIPALVLPNRNRSTRRAMQGYYSPETLALVRRIYARDFEIFGYRDQLPDPS
jgi:hypothetical protein